VGEGDDLEVLDLWPTRLLKRRLEEFEEPNRELLKLIRDLDRGKSDLTLDYKDNNILNLDQPGPNWLRAEVNRLVIDYLRGIGIDYPVNWQIHAWPNVNRLGDYHDTHNHPHSYLSGTYYVKVPTTKDTAGNRGDVRPGCITFYDPRGAANMVSIKDDPYVDPEHTVRPEAGLIMLWPAFLNHFVHPNLAKETRVSVSFNIVLKWEDHYLPDQ